jgi:acetolactate synthase I/II/III large subunit
VVHIDVDPAEHGKIRVAEVPIVGDAREAIEAINVQLAAGGVGTVDRTAWRSTVSGWQEAFPLKYEQSDSGFPLKPQYVLEQLRDLSPPDTIVVAGVGQHQMWASQFWHFNHPYTWINSGGLGTMGYAVPGAIGAQVGNPDATVWAVDGDGCFQMTSQELITAAAEGIPVKIAILNNSYLGMVRQWQELFYKERYSEVYLSPNLPDYVMLAEAMGCVGLRADRAEEVAAVIEQANAITDRPVVVDFRVDEFEKVYPMVPSGGSNDVVILGPEGDAELGKGAAPS